jgi:hypothetical protein
MIAGIMLGIVTAFFPTVHGLRREVRERAFHAMQRNPFL